MSDCVKVPVEGWEIQEIDHPIDDGSSIRSKGISYCVWKIEEPAVYLLLKAMIEASPEPESAEPVAYMRLHRTGLYIKMEHLSETQAKRNHYQSLERLNARGGISPAEALALIERRSYRTTGEFEATKKLLELVSEITKPPKQEQWRPYPRFKPDDCSVDPVVVCLLDDGRIKIGSYADNYDAFIHGGGSARVTHWMPLPQPPQE